VRKTKASPSHVGGKADLETGHGGRLRGQEKYLHEWYSREKLPFEAALATTGRGESEMALRPTEASIKKKLAQLPLMHSHGAKANFGKLKR
jgi:hypothetical protein